MRHEFHTPEPIELDAEINAGQLTVNAVETTQSVVTISGEDADRYDVEHDGSQLRITAPRQNFFGLNTRPVVIVVEVPTGSHVDIRSGSAEVRTTGDLSRCTCKSGSGAIHVQQTQGPTVLTTGSGEIRIESASDHLRAKSGSGDIGVGTVHGSLGATCGSGTIRVGRIFGPARLKTGSGDVVIDEVHAETGITTGSGDIAVGAQRRDTFTAKTASGQISVGAPADMPVWTDLSSVSGRIRSALTGHGEPAPGQEYLTVRASTVSGDISLHQV
ncbi:DUF4097 family beta strand repeat-containing protein [Nocardioides limicola]|uniref:DUF4097 family beta strand repeat-containing protein n=1 Tax=Nocardioides limicola TaxID=2803368 RepID=UPI00193BA5EA|nr:DUF4097 family beta strand repeat-containing protein [Nocardioides sp. DJM-14]